MKNIQWYVEKAQKKTGANSLNKLAPLIGINTASLSNLMRGRAFPTEKTMMQLADLAEIDHVKAFTDLNLWRSSTPKVRSVYQKMDALLSRAAMLMVVLLMSLTINSGANARSYMDNLNMLDTQLSHSHSIYYHFLII